MQIPVQFILGRCRILNYQRHRVNSHNYSQIKKENFIQINIPSQLTSENMYPSIAIPL